MNYKASSHDNYYNSDLFSGDANGYKISGSGAAPTITNNVGMTGAAFASGEICYLLNGSTSQGTLVWYQTIGKQATPQFEGAVVYYDETANPSYYNEKTESVAELAAIEVSMADELLLWQKFTLPEELVNDDNAYAVVTADKKGGVKETIIPMSEIRAAGADKNGRYIIEQGMAAPEMGRSVTVSFVDGNGNYVNLTDYSTGEVAASVSRTVIDYAKLALEKGNANQKNLNKALLTYGGYAQAYFNVDADAPVYNVLTELGIEVPDMAAIDGNAIDQEMTSTGAALVKASSQQAFLDSAIYHQVYFTLESGVSIDDLSFVLTKRNKAGEYTEEVEAVYDSAKKRYYIQIDGIASPLLDYMYNIEITSANGDVQNVKTSVAAYLKLGITKSTNAKQVNMFKAMYNYNQVANEFFGF